MRRILQDTLDSARQVCNGELPIQPLQGQCERLPQVQKTYDVRLVTPIFGGGVKSGINDVSKLIREPSIRGILHFWFRATSGAAYPTPKVLFERESKIFGATDTPSSVDIRVSNVDVQEPKSYSELSRNEDGTVGILGYVLFPFESDPKRNRQEGSGRLSSFKLHISYAQEYEKEIEIALWAWFNFGGIGARTRRGCGALYCKDFAPCIDNNNRVIWSFFKNQGDVAATLNNDIFRKWATLGGNAFIRPNFSDNSEEVWKEAIKDYRYFRQGVPFARNGRQNPPPGQKSEGRSRWPEPDAIRRITGRHSVRHAPDTNKPLTFPRAELGAPIEFRFLTDGDPSFVKVCPVEVRNQREFAYDRACSPIIVKPLVFTNGRSAPCVVFLNGPRVTDVKLKNHDGVWDVADPLNARYPNSPLSDYSPDGGSALAGFKNYIIQTGYRAIQ